MLPEDTKILHGLLFGVDPADGGSCWLLFYVLCAVVCASVHEHQRIIILLLRT